MAAYLVRVVVRVVVVVHVVDGALDGGVDVVVRIDVAAAVGGRGNVARGSQAGSNCEGRGNSEELHSVDRKKRSGLSMMITLQWVWKQACLYTFPGRLVCVTIFLFRGMAAWSLYRRQRRDETSASPGRRRTLSERTNRADAMRSGKQLPLEETRLSEP